MTARTALLALLLGALTTTALTACSANPSEWLSGSFRSWCRTADSCTDNSRRPPP